jgi:hypothetical protein
MQEVCSRNGVVAGQAVCDDQYRGDHASMGTFGGSPTAGIDLLTATPRMGAEHNDDTST